MVRATKRGKLSHMKNADRLSDLPYCVILHILSFLNAKEAIQTCVLSPRYKDLWKCLPSLILHSDDFRTYKIFTKFVSRVLSLRDSSISLEKLDFKSKTGCLERHVLRKVVNYFVSHNVQQLGLYVNSDISVIPPSMFSCQTLTHLKLSIYPNNLQETLFPKFIDLPALTNLKLENFTLTNLQLENFQFCIGGIDSVEPFSTFNRLNSLLISECNTLQFNYVQLLRKLL